MISKTKQIILTNIVFVSFACTSVQHKSIKDEIRESASENSIIPKKFIFRYDNKNLSSFGFKYFSDDESIGPKSIFLTNDYVYISDVFHSSIKKINIVTGEIISSNPLTDHSPDASGIWLRDVAEFNGKIYAPSDKDTLYVFSNNLKALEKISIESGAKQIERITADSLLIFLSSRQNEDKSIEGDYFSIDRNGRYERIQKTVPIATYTQALKEKRVFGKKYTLLNENGKNYFESEYGKIELETPIPTIALYGASNLDFDSKHLVFFNSSQKELILYVYQW